MAAVFCLFDSDFVYINAVSFTVRKEFFDVVYRLKYCYYLFGAEK
jgi:hypothetical protein